MKTNLAFVVGGALRAFLEAGYQPELLAGLSIEVINPAGLGLTAALIRTRQRQPSARC
jgi:hypothetical protein